jgi:hypothetical protein
MNENIEMEEMLLALGFTPDEEDSLKYNGRDKYWEYAVYFEGYAFVIYVEYSFYPDGVEKKTIEVPLAEFRNPFKFRKFWQLLTEYMED